MRALPAPIPLGDYPTPPRPGTSASFDGGESPSASHSPIALKDFILAPSSPPSVSPDTHALDLDMRPIPVVAKAADNRTNEVSTGIALAVLAAVNQTIHGVYIASSI